MNAKMKKHAPKFDPGFVPSFEIRTVQSDYTPKPEIVIGVAMGRFPEERLMRALAHFVAAIVERETDTDAGWVVQVNESRDSRRMRVSLELSHGVQSEVDDALGTLRRSLVTVEGWVL
ncbi:MAG: hypothetical protein PVSMB8_00330 [Vulcanimicrobiaceae bacterium]